MTLSPFQNTIRGTPSAVIHLLWLLHCMVLTAQSNLNQIPAILEVPEMSEGEPAPGRRVRDTTRGWDATKTYHAIYLPTDWTAERNWPLILEYPGNGGYANALGDVSNGTLEGCMMGYGLTAGSGFIWVSMPFLNEDGSQALKWWGDIETTKQYCKTTIREICKRYQADPDRVLLAGFSRGAIACNYLGLHDDSMATLWSGMICHSHYEGEFKHPAPDYHQWPERLKRLGTTPQFVSHETSVETIRRVIDRTVESAPITYGTLPFKNHSARWTLCDLPLRNQARTWLLSFANSTKSADPTQAASK